MPKENKATKIEVDRRVMQNLNPTELMKLPRKRQYKILAKTAKLAKEIYEKDRSFIDFGDENFFKYDDYYER